MLVVLAVAALIAIVVLAYEKVGWFRAAVDDAGHVAVAAFNAVKGVVMDVYNWVVQNWPYLIGALGGPFGEAAAFVILHWGEVVSFFEGIPGQLVGVFDGMWHGITEAFRGAINALIDIWNDLHFTLPGINFLGVHVGGETIGVPQLPHLAEGGLITRTGLVYAHAGEAITPAPRSIGPAVQVGALHLHDELDAETFMRRVAWVARTATL